MKRTFALADSPSTAPARGPVVMRLEFYINGDLVATRNAERGGTSAALTAKAVHAEFRLAGWDFEAEEARKGTASALPAWGTQTVSAAGRFASSRCTETPCKTASASN